MEKYIQVMLQIKDLSETCSEAIQYIRLRFEEGAFEQAAFLLMDLLEAVDALKQGLQPLAAWLDDDLMLLLDHFRDTLVSVLICSEQQCWHQVTGLVVRELIPRYDRWKKELDRSLDSCLLS
ncbi:MAG: hypothetical protein BAA01_02165 [Bacillus thermozeamaize]|uniref:DUF8042 domain-containing protein n=1 Tax=Bacillus thermozeamaize TaxID=230954 RepID=A0A1Y3PZM8_9BACI|nr:MAG: hypothetical protein BAA01_02165 [Bacillus thermozeamaize]